LINSFIHPSILSSVHPLIHSFQTIFGALLELSTMLDDKNRETNGIGVPGLRKLNTWREKKQLEVALIPRDSSYDREPSSGAWPCIGILGVLKTGRTSLVHKSLLPP
jgi:hypothetical protein